MQKAIKDLSIGDRVQLVQDNSIGEITKIEPCRFVEGADVIVEWLRTDNNETGQYIGSSDEIIETV